MSTRRARTMRRRRFRNARRPRGLGFAWLLWATLKATRRERFSMRFARRRMTELRLLVVRLGSLGDIVHTFPAVAGLRETFPKVEIVWLTHPRWKMLVQSSQLASEIWEVETRAGGSVRNTLTRIRKEQFTTAIDYQGLWKSAALPFLGRVPRRIGFSAHSVREFGVPLLYTDRVRCNRTHVAEQNGELSQCAGARKGAAAFLLSVPSLQEALALQLLRNFDANR